MINKIMFENFKSFSKGEIELKPITILLGANNVGKSSIIQLLLLLEQTANIKKAYNSALRLNGEYVKLGSVENIFRNMNVTVPLVLEFELGINVFKSAVKTLLEGWTDSIIEKYISTNRVYGALEDITFSDESLRLVGRRKAKDEMKGLYEYIKFAKMSQKKLKQKIKSDPKVMSDRLKVFSQIKYKDGRTEVEVLLDTDFDAYSETYDMLNKLDQLDFSSTSLFYSLRYNARKKNLHVEKIALKCDDKILIEYFKNTKHNLNSEILDQIVLNKYRAKFGNDFKMDSIFNASFIFDNPIFLRMPFRFLTSENKNVFTSTLIYFIISHMSFLSESFDSRFINYVSPLRAFPKRYYFLDKANISHSLNTIDGDNLTEILKEDKSIRDRVNKWLSKFQLKVTVSEIKDIIHQITVHQHGLNLDITDVGFGISQILPVIVQGFLSRENSLTIIEQPEIHLHPKMQAELADLFIDVIYSNNKIVNKRLLIETHSEYLLKRLRRRIAEGILNSSDVGLYFIHPRNSESDCARIENITIDKSGMFNWPVDFYSEDLIDTVEFLKHLKSEE
jgi:predicted ATPase